MVLTHCSELRLSELKKKMERSVFLELFNKNFSYFPVFFEF